MRISGLAGEEGICAVNLGGSLSLAVAPGIGDGDSSRRAEKGLTT